MTVSKKQQASVTKYVSANYDIVKAYMPKGTKEIIKAASKSTGHDSMGAYVKAAIVAQLEKDGFKAP